MTTILALVLIAALSFLIAWLVLFAPSGTEPAPEESADWEGEQW